MINVQHLGQMSAWWVKCFLGCLHQPSQYLAWSPSATPDSSCLITDTQGAADDGSSWLALYRPQRRPLLSSWLPALAGPARLLWPFVGVNQHLRALYLSISLFKRKGSNDCSALALWPPTMMVPQWVGQGDAHARLMLPRTSAGSQGEL